MGVLLDVPASRFRSAMYQLTHNGQLVGKAHPHKMAAYVEAVERKLVTVSRGLYQFVDGVKIEQIEQEQSK